MRLTAAEKRDAQQIEAFKAFVRQVGGEVLVPTNDYELVRFRGNDITSIIYRKANGGRTYTGQAEEAWISFVHQRSFRLAKRTKRISGQYLEPRDRAIAERDGDLCFYCFEPFSDEVGKQRTREHLVPVTAGGPNHVSNLFHACRDCNALVDTLSAPEKIRYREKKLLTRKWFDAAIIPEDGEEYLIDWDGVVLIAHFDRDLREWHDEGSNFIPADEIRGWMLLPEPKTQETK